MIFSAGPFNPCIKPIRFDKGGWGKLPTCCSHSYVLWPFNRGGRDVMDHSRRDTTRIRTAIRPDFILRTRGTTVWIGTWGARCAGRSEQLEQWMTSGNRNALRINSPLCPYKGTVMRSLIFLLLAMTCGWFGSEKPLPKTYPSLSQQKWP